MIEKILKAKHWQFFLVSYAIPMVIQFVFMNQMMGQFMSQIGTSPETIDPIPMFKQMAWMPLLFLPFMALLLAWQWAVVVGLSDKISEELRFSLSKFKICFFFPIFYFVVIMAGMAYFISIMFPAIFDQSYTPDVSNMGIWMMFILPMHFFAIFCMFYVMYYVAKTIKTAELNKATTFSDFASEFFLIWFFPIGIWILQPRINDLVEEKDILVDQIIE